MKDLSQESEKKLRYTKKLHTQGWVSLNGFSIITGISYPSVLKYSRQGKVRVVEVGGIKRVYADEVARFLNEGNYKE